MNIIRQLCAGEIQDYPSVGQVAKLIYPDACYDTALPQVWVDIIAKYGFDPRGHFVWMYPDKDIAGYPAPVTDEGIVMLAKLASATVVSLHIKLGSALTAQFAAEDSVRDLDNELMDCRATRSKIPPFPVTEAEEIPVKSMDDIMKLDKL